MSVGMRRSAASEESSSATALDLEVRTQDRKQTSSTAVLACMSIHLLNDKSTSPAIEEVRVCGRSRNSQP